MADLTARLAPTSAATSAPAARRRAGPVVALSLLVILGALLLWPAFGHSFLLMKLMCFALFAAAFNLVFGYCGLLSFGHAAFFGGAAYVSAHAMKVWGFNPEAAVALAVLAALALGLVIGAIAQRRTGLYYTMITLALSQMVYFYCLQAPWTQGEDGIQSVPRGYLFGVIDLSNGTTLYYVVLAVTVLAFAAIWRIVHSPYGAILLAIKQNEQRAISLGYAVGRYKLGTFVMSAGFAGLAGGMKAIVFQFATLTDVLWTMSGEVVLMTLLGGIGTLAGPVVGAAVIILLQNVLATSQFPVSIITGLVFMTCVMVFRRGIMGEFYASPLGRRLGLS